MSLRSWMTWLIVLVALFAFVRAVSPQPAAPHFVVSGTSTVRNWSCPADGIAKVVTATSLPAVPGFPHGLQRVEVRVPVKAIACEEPLMLEHLRETLNEKAHPEIVYEMTEYALTAPDTAQTKGTLTIGGVSKSIALTMKLSASGAGVRSVGETTIDLTQYSITPPVIFEGLLKVGKDVRIRFDAVLQSSQKAGGLHD